MKDTLRTGITGTLTTKVSRLETITLGQDERATVFSTPSMINLMEHAAREALAPHLESGEESVGIDVLINHSAATPARSSVTATATVTDIVRNVISFDVVASDAWGDIGKGTHRRAVVETSHIVEKLSLKSVGAVGAVGSADLPATESISVGLNGPVLKVTLARTKKRNALSEQMTGELERLIEWLAHPECPVRIVVVSGGENFCAGDDVGEITADPKSAAELSLRRGALYKQITTLSQPFVAALDGQAMGGGLVFAAACDIRIATQRARFALPEASLGWLPNYGMGIVQSLLGRGRTLDLVLTGRTLGAREAHEIGLVNRIVSPVTLAREVDAEVQRLLGNSPTALASAKRLLAPDEPWSDRIAAAEFVDCLQTDQAQASLARFRR